jgi:tRNA(Ile2) C34 agmatinyltransferase TiaS
MKTITIVCPYDNRYLDHRGDNEYYCGKCGREYRCELIEHKDNL